MADCRNWDYADMSHSAKLCGGPAALAKTIYYEGYHQGRISMFPMLCVATIGASVLSIAVVKLIEVMHRREQVRRLNLRYHEQEIVDLNNFSEESMA